MSLEEDNQSLKVDLCRATRCWKSNNIKLSLFICDKLTKQLGKLLSIEIGDRAPSLIQLKHNVWFLKLRCLADDHYVNESLLLNEEDIGSEDQVRLFSGGTKQGKTGSIASTKSTKTTARASQRINTGTLMESAQQRTAILTGRMPSVSTRHSSRATSSYRPLTTSLTANKTAFSRSTRPLLKYSECNLLAKLIFEYLYNAQAVTSQCPDYRQCLEYLNLVLKSTRKRIERRFAQQREKNTLELKRVVEVDERKWLDAFWLISFGTCYYNLNMNKEAEEYFRSALETDPKSLDSYAWLVKIYLRSNQATKVMQTCELGLKHSKNSILFNWMARVQSLMGDVYSANESLSESLRYCPTNIEALANVGHFTFYGDKIEQSLKCFDRIQKLSLNQSLNLETSSSVSESAELLNNLALCNFYCGYLHKVMPLFTRSFLNASSREVTSNIWYNVSFIPLSCGFKNLAIVCLNMALKSNSQNEEALNNLGVLKYESLLNDFVHHNNKQELWNPRLNTGSSLELENLTDQQKSKIMFETAETFFAPTAPEEGVTENNAGQPEMLYNMAILKRCRGHLLESEKYCRLYLKHDHKNFHMLNMLRDIKSLVSHDG